MDSTTAIGTIAETIFDGSYINFSGKPAIVVLLRLHMPFNINDTHEEFIKWFVISVIYCILVYCIFVTGR